MGTTFGCWVVRLTMAVAALSGGCATRMTLRDYVNTRVLRANPGLQTTVEAADLAQVAFNLNADTPIEDLRENSATP